MTGSVFTVVPLALSAAAVWVTVFVTMPAVARTRLQRQAELARDRIIDAMLDGDVDFDNPHAQDALKRCLILETHARDLTLSAALGAVRGTKQTQAHPEDRFDAEDRRAAVRRASTGKSKPQGEYLLAAVDRYLVRILAHYLVRGSSLWWVWVPLQRASWVLRSRKVPVAAEVSHAIDQPLPGDIARQVFEERPEDFDDSIWNGHHGIGRHRKRSVQVA